MDARDGKNWKKTATRGAGVLLLILAVWYCNESQKKSPIQFGALPGPEKISYSWRLYDLYNQEDFVLVPKPEMPTRLMKTYTLNWQKGKGPDKTYIQFAMNPDFKEAERFTAIGKSFDLERVFVGENYWRVSEDGMHWGEPQRFVVEPGFLTDPPPQVKVDSEEVPLADSIAYAPIRLKSAFISLGFVMEASKDLAFEPSQTKSFWTSHSEFRLSFFEPGDYYYRFRAVNHAQEMTEWSLPQKFHVFRVQKPEEPAPEFVLPTVAKRERRHYPKAPKTAPPPEAAAEPAPIAEQEIKVPEIAPLPSETSVAKLPPPRSYLNEKYDDSRVDLEGSAWTMQSKEQSFQHAEMPVSTSVGVRGMHWWGKHGAEGSFKVKAVGANQAGNEMSPMAGEARYHYRFHSGFPFGFFRELQTSVFGGYEMYRNNGGGAVFSAKYDLFKFGTSLEFPLANRWDTGGELVLGLGSDNSKKYEISGRIHYFIKKQWSAGVGYRIHLFEAGSTASAPVPLPFREGYTEGYSVLRYHF